jgi:excisionase family DNA binding protein
MVTPTQKPTKNSYTLKEAAEFLQISQRTIERLIARGLIRKSKFSRRIIMPGIDIENLVERTC